MSQLRVPGRPERGVIWGQWAPCEEDRPPVHSAASVALGKGPWEEGQCGARWAGRAALSFPSGAASCAGRRRRHDGLGGKQGGWAGRSVAERSLCFLLALIVAGPTRVLTLRCDCVQRDLGGRCCGFRVRCVWSCICASHWLCGDLRKGPWMCRGKAPF